MYIKKYLIRYGLVSIGLPLAVYMAAIFCSDNICVFASISLIIIAAIVVLFSKNILNYVFDDRDNTYIDKEYVIKISCVLIAMFFVRYILANILFLVPVFKEEITQIIMAPIWILLFIPFLNNYCLNKRTITCAILLSIGIVYVFFPIAIYFLDGIIDNEYFIADSVYYNYYGYNIVANRILASACSLTGIDIPVKLIFIVLQVINLCVWCIMYLPYLTITAVVVDERTYLEKGTYMKVSLLLIAVVALAAGVIWCSMLSADGVLHTDYVLRHNL